MSEMRKRLSQIRRRQLLLLSLIPPMSKVQHQSLVGKLTFDEEAGCYRVDGFNIDDVLEAMLNLDVQLEIVGHQTNSVSPDSSTTAPGTDFLKKLLGGDGTDT